MTPGTRIAKGSTSARREERGAQRRRWRSRGAAFSLLYLAAAPVVAGVLAHRLWLRRRALVGLDEKLFGDQVFGDSKAISPGQIMVHGVSLGEVTLMRPLVPRLEQALASGGMPARCLLTTTTETGKQGLDKHFPGHERAFLPLDVPWAVNRFLGRAKPRLVVLLEFELWPILLCACLARGIPVVLVNAKISERSWKRFMAAGSAMRPLFRALTLVLAQNSVYAARLSRLGVRPERLRVCGSMKADIVVTATPAQVAAERSRLGLGLGDGPGDGDVPLFLAASTSAGEERQLVESWKTWGRPRWRLVICPRHPERGEEIARMCESLGVPAVRTSLVALSGGAVGGATGASAGDTSSGSRPARGGAIVVDEIGRLAALYALAADPRAPGIAVVGGSLGSGRGGQNMLEAAAAGCCTVVGWDTRSQPDSMTLLRRECGVVELERATLDATLAALAVDEPRRRRVGAAGVRAWRTGLGATARVAEAIGGLRAIFNGSA